MARYKYADSVPADDSHFDIVVTTIVGTVVNDIYGDCAPLVMAFKIIGEHLTETAHQENSDHNYRFTTNGRSVEVNVNVSSDSVG